MNPTGHPVHRPTINQPSHAIKGLRGRRWSAASTGLPTASHPHRGKLRAGRPARKRPNPCRNFTMQLVLLRRCMYRTARVVLCQPAGVTTAPCRIDPTGLPEQALNLLLLAVSPSGTRKTMTKSHALRSQAVAPTTWNPAARTTPRCPFTIRHQPPIANRQSPDPPKRSRLPNDNRPATAHLLPPAAAMSPPAGTPFVTGTSSRIKARRQTRFCVAPAT